jgi:hypothetical protein
MLSSSTSRQAVETFKCCPNVYDSRPGRTNSTRTSCSPWTPAFQDINPTGFTQVINLP